MQMSKLEIFMYYMQNQFEIVKQFLFVTRVILETLPGKVNLFPSGFRNLEFPGIPGGQEGKAQTEHIKNLQVNLAYEYAGA